MQYRQHRRKKKLMSEINVVPYIDVMLVLLVIFMITAPLLAQNVKVDLPQAKAQAIDSRQPENLVITVNRRGQYFLDDRSVAADALVDLVGARLKAQPKTSVQVRGDREAIYGEIVKLMAILQDAGATSVGLLTEPPS